MGEEWRRGWHPERIPAKESDTAVLIVGGGPAGLEAARALGQRGYPVTLAEARGELGGRVALESRLPGLSAWARVRDYRLQQLREMANVNTYLDSMLGVAEVLEFGFPVVALATGARWRRDGVGRFHASPVAGFANPAVFTPDDLMTPELPTMPPGPVVVFDDDHYYMAAVLAERLVNADRAVTLVTTGGMAGSWGIYTEEDWRTNRHLIELGVTLHTNAAVTGFENAQVTASCIFTGRETKLEAAALVTVTARTPDDDLYRALAATENAGIRKLACFGDASAPALIAHAVYAGHRFARELDSDVPDSPTQCEMAQV
jgi:dimethylamine/trimethylamine dehydrogenase